MVSSLLQAAFALVGLAASTVATDVQLSVRDPVFYFNYTTPATQCRGFTVRWAGGKPPFNIHLVPISYGNGIQPFNISTEVTDEPYEYTWNLEWPAGSPFLMTMTDASGWGSAPVSDIIVPERGQSSCMKLQGIFAEGLGFAFGITPGDEERHPQCSPHFITWDTDKVRPVPPLNIYGVMANGTAWSFPTQMNMSDQIDWTLDLPVGAEWSLFAKDQNATGLFQGGWLQKIPVDPPVDTPLNSCVRQDSPRFIKLSTPGAKSAAGISGGVIGGIVAAIVVALLVIGALVWWFLRRRKRSSRNSSPNGSLSQEGGLMGGRAGGSGSNANKALLDDGEHQSRYPPGQPGGYNHDDDKLAPTPFLMHDGRNRSAFGSEPRASLSEASQGQSTYPASDAGYSDTVIGSVGGRSAPNTLSTKLADERKNMMAANPRGQFGEMPGRQASGDANTDLLQSILANQQALSAALSEAAHANAPPPMYEDAPSSPMVMSPPHPQGGHVAPSSPGHAAPSSATYAPAPAAQSWRPDVKGSIPSQPHPSPDHMDPSQGPSGPSGPHH